jgi:hypothetical protein
MMLLHPNVALLAFFQGTQLSLFERFLTQAVSGINSTSITSGMQNAAYVVLLVGFLWQMYQAALHGGDVRGLGTSLIKYIVTALVVMNYTTVFTAVNQGFVNAGSWISNASGAGNLFENWANDIQTQFSQDGAQQMWGLITGSMAGLIDAILILVAYILYPVVVAVFGFFYIFYGSVLYIFGPIVIALMPLGATNRLAKAYVENVMIWNAWPILYGGFGALLSAVQMGQVGQMLNQNNFLGGLGNLEGSFLIGAASIVYSLAIAVIPFIAKRIVSGDVGSTAGALIGAAATALTVGAAAVEGAVAGRYCRWSWRDRTSRNWIWCRWFGCGHVHRKGPIGHYCGRVESADSAAGQPKVGSTEFRGPGFQRLRQWSDERRSRRADAEFPERCARRKRYEWRGRGHSRVNHSRGQHSFDRHARQ